MTKLPKGAVEVKPQLLETVAYIIGPHSAAQQALNDADAHSGPVKFYKYKNTFIVEKITND